MSIEESFINCRDLVVIGNTAIRSDGTSGVTSISYSMLVTSIGTYPVVVYLPKSESPTVCSQGEPGEHMRTPRILLTINDGAIA